MNMLENSSTLAVSVPIQGGTLLQHRDTKVGPTVWKCLNSGGEYVDKEFKTCTTYYRGYFFCINWEVGEYHLQQYHSLSSATSGRNVIFVSSTFTMQQRLHIWNAVEVIHDNKTTFSISVILCFLLPIGSVPIPSSSECSALCRAATANSGTNAAVQPKGKSSTAESGTKVAVFLGMNRCGSFPLISEPYSS